MDLQETDASPILKLNDLRARALAGEELTSDEYKAVLDSLRRARSAAPSPSARKGKTTSTPMNIDLLGDF